MKKLVVDVTEATQNRIDRIKELRKTPSGYVMDDQEIFQAAIVLYWTASESRHMKTERNNGK